MENKEIRTKQHKRAEFSLNILKKIYPDMKVNEKVSTFIVGMPTMILSNGIGQTMAYLASRKEKPDRLITYQIIHTYISTNYKVFSDLLNDNGITKPDFTEKDYEFLTRFTKCSQKEYIEIQEDVLRMIEWLKRYARAFSEIGSKTGD